MPEVPLNPSQPNNQRTLIGQYSRNWIRVIFSQDSAADRRAGDLVVAATDACQFSVHWEHHELRSNVVVNAAGCSDQTTLVFCITQPLSASCIWLLVIMKDTQTRMKIKYNTRRHWRRLHRAEGRCPQLLLTAGHGAGTVSRKTANKKLTRLYWPSRKRSPKRLIVPLEPKGEGRDNFF